MSSPVDHELECARNRTLALVHLWMSVWDSNKGDAAPLLDLLSPQGFTIVLTEEGKTLTTINEVQAWFKGFSTLVKSDNHMVQSVELETAGEVWLVTTTISCPGVAANGSPFSVRSIHEWEVVDYGGLLPRIQKMKIKLIK